VVTVEFPGSTGVKRRPAVVISSELYQSVRPDVVLALLTSQLQGASAPTDYHLQDWSDAGLQGPSAFRAFFATLAARNLKKIGRLSDRDWEEVKSRLRIAIAFT
jgi:mRNA interferase MazF